MAETATKEVLKKEAIISAGIERTRSTKVYAPAVDIMERQDDIVIIADMAGVDEQSVDITLDNKVLTIYGTVEPEIPENQRLAFAEYGVGDYQRVFTLTDEIDREKIQASVKNGVLKLILPKAKKAETRKIAVKAET